jgi:ubiquinone/menaquinone biosynthesis C-methylase UbiE
MFLAVLLACVLQLTNAAPAHAQGSAGPYVPTPTVIVDELLKLADIKRGEFVIDLGSGDGRIVITAAKRYGASGYGIDIQESLVDLARQNARKEGVDARVKFVAGDLFNSDLSKADVVTVYLLPSTVPRLVPKLLKELRPGARVVSHDYPLEPWTPEKVLTFNFEEKVMISGTTRTVLYLYIVPPRAAGK